MWTDDQLRQQGWTDQQIASRRVEQAAEGAPISTELPAENIPIPIVQEKIEAVSNPIETTGIASSVQGLMPVILLAAMLLLVPFSIYSISNACLLYTYPSPRDS